MDANIDCAPGADDNPLAAWAAERVRDNVAATQQARRDFYNIRAAVVLVAPDRRLQATLRFDHGYLTIHDGMIGIPDVTLCGDYEVLMGLESVPVSRIGRLPLPPVSDLFSGELKIYGLFTHPLLVTRVLRMLVRSYS